MHIFHGYMNFMITCASEMWLTKSVILNSGYILEFSGELFKKYQCHGPSPDQTESESLGVGLGKQFLKNVPHDCNRQSLELRITDSLQGLTLETWMIMWSMHWELPLQIYYQQVAVEGSKHQARCQSCLRSLANAHWVLKGTFKDCKTS